MRLGHHYPVILLYYTSTQVYIILTFNQIISLQIEEVNFIRMLWRACTEDFLLDCLAVYTFSLCAFGLLIILTLPSLLIQHLVGIDTSFINPLCYATRECCFHDWTYKPRLDDLAKDFDDHLFGQHLAKITILGAIHGHVTDPNPQKPLVLSLHGPAGTGKNHISRLLVGSLFTRGINSKFVTVKMSTKDYPHKEYLNLYKKELVLLVTSKVSACPHHVFIFDEVDNMPAGLLDSIKTVMDYHDTVDGINFRKAIFIFRSNLAATAIIKHVQDQYDKGRAREDITLLEMENFIKKAILQNPDAGLYKAKIIDSHLISHFVPFLPLEPSHIMQCIQAEIWAKGRQPNLTVENQVLAQLQFYGKQGSLPFAVKGCKSVAEKVNIILYEHDKQMRKNREWMRQEL